VFKRQPIAVVFDIGGVLVDWSLRYLYARRIPDPDECDAFLKTIITPDWHFKHDAGEDVAGNMAKKYSEHPDFYRLIQAYDTHWMESIGKPIDGVWPIVEQLAQNAIPLYALTNFAEPFWPRFRHATPITRCFKNVLVSGEVKLAKPDPRIFQLSKAIFGLRDGEALFIDDRAENVASAQQCGYWGHHFTSASALKTCLESYQLI
jgi:2-haloacid dehalogenase